MRTRPLEWRGAGTEIVRVEPWGAGQPPGSAGTVWEEIRDGPARRPWLAAEARFPVTVEIGTERGPHHQTAD